MANGIFSFLPGSFYTFVSNADRIHLLTCSMWKIQHGSSPACACISLPPLLWEVHISLRRFLSLHEQKTRTDYLIAHCRHLVVANGWRSILTSE